MPELLSLIQKAISDRLGEDIVTIDLRGVNPFSDYYVICTALNQRNAKAIATNVEDEVEKNGFTVREIEGDESSDWILMDINEVVVHIFVGDARYVYDLEKLWGDLPRIKDEK